MQQQNIPIGTLVDMYKRGELRLPKSSATTSGAPPGSVTCWTRSTVATPAALS